MKKNDPLASSAAEPLCPACQAAAPAGESEPAAASPAEEEHECCRHKARTPEEKRALIVRLNRIEGQVRGIRRMIENDVYCSDVLVQVMAAKAALNGFSKELLDAHIRTCVTSDIKAGKEGTVDELLFILDKMMK